MTRCIVVSGEKSRHDLDLDQTMPNVNLIQAIFIYYIHVCSSFKWMEPLCFELLCTQTDRQTHRQTDMSTL